MVGKQTPYRRRFRKGAVRAATLVERDIRRVGESRGFAVTRLLTHWPEIAGDEIAAISQPVNVSFSKGGMGGTLTILTSGANAPMVQMMTERLRERVNAAYGYQAIRRVHVTQTAARGFGEDAAPFAHKPKSPEPIEPAVAPAARDTARDVTDPGLRAALERLGTNVLGPRSRK